MVGCRFVSRLISVSYGGGVVRICLERVKFECFTYVYGLICSILNRELLESILADCLIVIGTVFVANLRITYRKINYIRKVLYLLKNKFQNNFQKIA